MAKIFDVLKKMVQKEQEVEKTGIEAIERMKKQAETASKAGEEVRAEKEK